MARLLKKGANNMRVKRGRATKKRHKKILAYAKGYVGSKSKLYRSANQAVMKAFKYAYRHRRQKKRDFRKLWIIRINAACRENGLSYSKFIDKLNKSNIKLNRKVLADLAVADKEAFKQLVSQVKAA